MGVVRPALTFEEAVAALSRLEKRGWRLGLDRMEEFVRRAGLADALGRGAEGPRYLHVAGTNGKGSVTAYLQSMLVEHGFRTGAFFSPYVYDLRERVQFDRDLISREDFARLVGELLAVGDSLASTPLGGVTEFELKTGLGFRYWKEKRAEWVALEVGLGGRLDATNVVSPSACCIVSVGRDHVQILGDTVEAIAREKAGIIKPNVPVVVGRLSSGPLREVLEIAEAARAPAWVLDREVILERQGEGWSVRTPLGLFTGLDHGIRGSMQPENMALAVATLSASRAPIDLDAVRKGVRGAFAPGRYQRATHRGARLILDGAHNEDAAKNLARSLELDGVRRGSVVLLTSMLQGHDVGEFYTPLHGWVSEVHVAPVDFFRARPVEELALEIGGVLGNAHPHATVSEALEASVRAAGEERIVLVTGSFYLVGEVGNLIRSFKRSSLGAAP